MLLEWVTASAAVLLTVWLFRRKQKKKPKKKEIQLTICTPSWSPLNILWIDSLPSLSMSICSDVSDKHQNSVSDEASWCVTADNQFSPCVREEFYNFSGPSDSQTNILRQELLQFPLSPSSGKKSDSENGTIGLGCISPPPNSVLQTSNSYPLVTVSSQGFVQ